MAEKTLDKAAVGLNIFQIITQLLAALGKYGPVLSGAIPFIVAGNWAGLIAYLESVIAKPPVGLGSAFDAAGLDNQVQALKKALADHAAAKA